METFAENEDDVFCERVISDLDNVLKNSHNAVQSFEVIQIPFKQNKSPIQLVHHHLGIESWCIAPIYKYAHRLIIRHRQQNRFPSSIVKYLNCAILLNPDVSTFWNVRRHLLTQLQLDITSEFQFSALVLSKKPKSSEAFFYRRWLYSFQSGEAIDWAVEISLCERCAERKNGNYHAWNHRQWVLQKAPELLPYELIKTERFIRKNIADYSCYHHRHFVLTRLFDQQYFDVHDADNVAELVRFVGSPELTVKDVAKLLLPSVNVDAANQNKLKSFLFSLNLAVHDLRMMRELAEMYGNYESFKCYKRVVVKFAVEIVQLANGSDYLMLEGYQKTPPTTPSDEQPEVIAKLMQQLDDIDDEFLRIFF